MVEAFQCLSHSEHFRVVRLKNKIGALQAPFNLHVNLLFHPKEVEDPILCEVQLYPEDVFELQHCQHILYELKRAPSLQDM